MAIPNIRPSGLQSASDIKEVRTVLEGRMKALANAQSLMLTEGGADLALLLRQMLELYGDAERIKIAAPSLTTLAKASPRNPHLHREATEVTPPVLA